MSKQAVETSAKDERLFLFALLALAGILMGGVLLVMVELNKPSPYAGSGPEELSSMPIPPDRPRRLADFSLTNWTGSCVTRADLKEKFLVVDFLFTGCSVTCPVINNYMAQIQQLTAHQNDVRLLSLTVDPRDDTVPVLADYAKRFGADASRWLLLTGDKDGLYNLIKTSFLNQDLDPAYGYMPGNFSHTDRIAIVDANGTLRAFFDGLNQNTPTAVVNEIAALRKESL
jgi:protein SCO1